MKIKGLIIGIIFFTIGILLSTGTFVRAEDSNESLVNLLGRKEY